jgi:hypothetical protein
MHPMLRTPVLCVKPLNDPIALIFLKTLEAPQRDTSERGWKLVIKLRVQCKEDEFKSEIIRLSPTTSHTSDQQLDDVVAAIREFKAQAIAREEATKTGQKCPTTNLDFQHLLASPDELSRNELPEYFTQSSVQTSVLEVRSLLPVYPQAVEERAETCSSEQDATEDFPDAEDVVPRPSLRDSVEGAGKRRVALAEPLS